MTVQFFFLLLAFFSVVTSLCTQAVKMFLDDLNVKYASNIVVLLVASIVGIGGMVAIYLILGYEWDATNIICIPIMVLANWLSAMLGYDKIVQAIKQIKE